MTDLTTLAAQRCAELANAERNSFEFYEARHFTGDSGVGLTFRQFVEQAHHLATEALAHPERAAEILKPMILVEPVDADLLIAREAVAEWFKMRGTTRWARDALNGKCDDEGPVEASVLAIRLYRQREGGSNAG